MRNCWTQTLSDGELLQKTEIIVSLPDIDATSEINKSDNFFEQKILQRKLIKVADVNSNNTAVIWRKAKDRSYDEINL